MKNQLLIIYYHEVVKEVPGYSYQKIRFDHFEQEMKYLADNGYRSLHFSELSDPIPNKSIIVSFDDGFRTVYENAAPVMQKFGIKGNIYLPTDYIGQDEHFMTWNMVQELYRSGLFEMQAHTHTHSDIRALSARQLKDEITASDKLFQEKLGYLPPAFCMPFGVWDRRSARELRDMDRFRYILGSHYGRVSGNRLSSCVLPRIGISNDDTIDVFAGKLRGAYDWKGPMQLARLAAKNLRKERVTRYEY